MLVYFNHRVNVIMLSIMIPLMLQGCAVVVKRQALPKALEDKVEMPGMPPVRAWGDQYNKSLEQSAIESVQQERAAHHGKLPPEANALALSGGSAAGAFGAGLLCGWTKAGNRPQFKLVTGISTGALMAPFAFLGPEYDDKLRFAYTSISDDNIYKPYSIVRIVLSFAKLTTVPSLADTKPLAELIAKLIDERVLKAIAAEHLKGRRLIVGTTQLDAQRLVIWNMGAIAASNSPNALELFRKILLASSAMPATFPPQIFHVMAEGKNYQEVHVDGGVEAQVMLYEEAISPFSRRELLPGTEKRIRKLYIIRNQSVYPSWDNVQPTLQDIAIRSIDGLIQSQSIGDLYRLYTYSLRDGFEYNLAYVPESVTETPPTPFDKKYMNKLFDLGFKMGKAGYKWNHYPYGYKPA